MKRKMLVILAAVAGAAATAAAIIIPMVSVPETNISLGGIIPDMTDENRKTEVATFALG